MISISSTLNLVHGAIRLFKCNTDSIESVGLKGTRAKQYLSDIETRSIELSMIILK